MFVFIGLSCAKQGFPPGGPGDDIPPFLVKSLPASQSTGIPKTDPIIFEFSESMDTESVENNLFIVPIPASWPEYTWKSRGKELTLHFSQPLRDNTTYVITIGSNARDLRNNQLKDSIVLSFATGDTIENRKIRGKVIPFSFFGSSPEKVSGIDVVLYRIDATATSPDPRNDVPDYVTQSGSDGTYEVVGLSSGKYRLFAIGDNDRDGFYSEGYDLVGMVPYDMQLAESDSIAFAPDIAISARDTSMVQLVSLSVTDSRRIELFFDRGIDPSSVHVSCEGLDIIDWFVPSGNPRMISIATVTQKDGKRYTIKNLTVSDRDGNLFQSLGIIPYFMGTDRPDTTALQIVEWRPKILLPGDEHIKVIFNRVLDLPENIEEIITDATSSDLSVIRSGPNAVELFSEKKWQENSEHRVFFNTDRVVGAAGNRLTSPGSQLAFRVVSSDTLGFINGSIEDYTGNPGNTYQLIFKNLDAEIVSELIVPGVQEWTTGPVLPGRYVCYAFKDDDDNGELFRGSIHPYKFAEQVLAYSDTITVNSRWTNDGNNFVFR